MSSIRPSHPAGFARGKRPAGRGKPRHGRVPTLASSAGRLLRRPRLLVTGCGDVGLRLLAGLAPHLAAGRLAVTAVSRDGERRAAARALGARAPALDLDDPRALERLGGLARWTIHLAPPPRQGEDDPRLAGLIAALARRGAGDRARPRWVLVGTTGVYGDCAGAEVDETRPIAPITARARRRASAERRLRAAVRRGTLRGMALRVPGLYAHDRLPTERLRRGLPVPLAHEDGYTNHLHADDLATICWLALLRGRPGRVLNAVDDSRLRLGEWLELVAEACHLPRPPRLPRVELAGRLSPAAMSFLDESRRLSNRRLKNELRVRLRWPTVQAALAEVARRATCPPPVI